MYDVLKSYYAYESPWVNLRLDMVKIGDHEDQRIPYHVVEREDGVLVVPITDEGKAVMVEQYRHGIGEVTLEFPGGGAKDGDKEAAVHRELLEETGYTVESLSPLGWFAESAGSMTTRIFVYVGYGAEKVQEPDRSDPLEQISVVHELELPELKTAIRHGRVKAGNTLCAYTMLREETAQPPRFEVVAATEQ